MKNPESGAAISGAGRKGKRAWKTSEVMAVVVTVAFGVALVVLAVVLPTLFCQQDMVSAMVANTSAVLARLEKELAVTNQSFNEAQGYWDDCKKQLGVLEGKASELEQALTNMTQLQEENRVLKEEVAQQKQQLEDLQSSRDEIQLENQRLEKQIQDMQSQHSSGNRLPTMSFSLLVLLFLHLGMLVL